MKKCFQKLLSLILIFALNFIQLSSPILVLAQESTPSATITPSPLPTATPLPAIATPIPTAYPSSTPSATQTPPVSSSTSRTTASGDLTADVIIGQRDFTEITPKTVAANRVFNPNGVIVDRNTSPGRAYIWDSGNNRVLGFDLAKCYANPAQSCNADMVFGQPSLNDYGACNGDSGFTNYPNRAQASATSLCGIWEGTHTVLEDNSRSNMFVDQDSNLYIPDFRNHRVLKYNNPLSAEQFNGKGDNVADEVWGQDDFSGNECNKTGNTLTGNYSTPSSSSLCFMQNNGQGAGVTVDSSGNVWIVDGGNNRVLRFPKNPATGTVSKTADLVLGQQDFTHGLNTAGSSLSQMRSPEAIRFDSSGKLYVADSGNNRILVFQAPFTTGMAAGGTFGTDILGPGSIEMEPAGKGILVTDNGTRVRLFDFSGNVKATLTLGNRTGGSIGVDGQGNLLLTEDVYGQDIFKFAPRPDGGYFSATTLLQAKSSFNQVSDQRLDNTSWGGVAVVGNQLVVSLSRLLFWNNADSLTNGKPADGYLGAESPVSYPANGESYGQAKPDTDNRLWVARGRFMGNTKIEIYQAPLHSGDRPVKTITSVKVLGTNQLVYTKDVHGIAPAAHGEFLWVSEPSKNRVYRIRNPLSDNPVIDVMLGQKSFTADDSNYLCNRGEAPSPAAQVNTPIPDRTMICVPGALSIDKKGNLFVSDHTIEAAGNFRLLMFSPDLFPVNPSSVIFAPTATKEFPNNYTWSANKQPHMIFETAFDSSNRMVAGYNPYSGLRFIQYYNDPTKINPVNPSDYTYALPDGQFKDFYGWPVGMAFDNNDNLYVLDANRSRVLIYRQPFASQASPKPIPTPTPIATPFPLPTSTPAVGPIKYIPPTSNIPQVTSVTITPQYPTTNSILTAQALAAITPSSASTVIGNLGTGTTDPGSTFTVVGNVGIGITNPYQLSLINKNGNTTFKYQWKKNGVDIPGETTNTLDLAKPGNGDKGDFISVEVIATDGSANSLPFITDKIIVGNTAPVATRDSLLAIENTKLVFPASSLVANDYDTDKDTLKLDSIIAVTHGSASLSQGNITFIPEVGYTGKARLYYFLFDGSYYAIGSAEVNIIKPLNNGSAIIAPVVNIQPQAPNIVIGNTNIDSVINVPANTEGAALDTSNVITTSKDTKSASIPNNIVVNSSSTVGTLNITIPAGITIFGPLSWNGNIVLPAIVASSSVTAPTQAGSTTQTTAVIEVGAGNTALTFNKAVRLVIPGKAGQLAGYSRNGIFTAITTTCSADSQTAGDSLTDGGDCKIDSGSDLVIWTKHFTKFATYTQTASQVSTSSGGSSGSSGGNGSTTQAPTCNDPYAGGAPALLSATASGDNQVTLVWSKAKDPVTHYVVSYGLEAGKPLYGNPNAGGKDTTTYTVKNLSGEVTYYFRVRAGNGCNAGEYSNEIAVYVTGEIKTEAAAEGFQAGVLGNKADSANSADLAGTGGVKGDKNQASLINNISKTLALAILIFVIGSQALYFFRRKNK